MICSFTPKLTILSFVLTVVKSNEELHLTKIINGSHFSSIFSGVGRFLIWPVDIKLSENAIPIQKPA